MRCNPAISISRSADVRHSPGAVSQSELKIETLNKLGYQTLGE
jgi:hypothetical protein